MSGTRRKVLLGFSLLALLTVAKTNRVNQETTLCSNDNTPMCARCRSEYLLFKNECDLRKAQRENLMGAPLFDVSLQNCVPSCEFECSDGFHPICGVSAVSGVQRTFRNRCEMARTSCKSKSNWLVYKWGVCPSGNSQSKQTAHTVLVGQRKRRQPVPCTNVYRPVCASYAGVKSTFSNECLVNSENIRTGRNWRVISEGLCGEDSIKMKHNRKYKPKDKPKVEMERSKRSHKQLNQLDDFEISEDAVQIFAPSTFHTQFISNSGTMEKSYSLPARKPYPLSKPMRRGIYGSTIKYHDWDDETHSRRQSAIRESGKPCVFSNEPVCGSFNGDTRTFSNVCSLMEYSQAVGNAWTILYDGTCRQCDKPCPTVYSPICANRNGIDYTIINECYLERVRCKDPNSDWKITHKGECTNTNGQVTQNIPKFNPKPLSSIPSMLYSAYTMSPPSLTTQKPRTTTVSIPRRKLRKYRRTTTMATPMDFSNRRIRKIELAAFDKYNPNMPIKDPQSVKMSATSKLWASKDNWLMHQNLDQFNKKPKKYAHYSWSVTTMAPTELLSTTATTTTEKATTTTETAETSVAEDNHTQQIMHETTSESENLFKVDTTSLAAEKSLTEETTTRSAATVETTAADITPTDATTSVFATLTDTTTLTAPVKDESTTMLSATIKPEEPISVASTIINEGTTEILDSSTTMETIEAVETAETEKTVEALETTAASATLTVGSDVSTMSNLDYMTDDSLLNQSDQTSIYGLDKNSLIMRLLRARSSKNMVL